MRSCHAGGVKSVAASAQRSIVAIGLILFFERLSSPRTSSIGEIADQTFTVRRGSQQLRGATVDHDDDRSSARQDDDLIEGREIVRDLFDVDLVELEVDGFRRGRIAQVFITLSPEVAKWWTALDSVKLTAKRLPVAATGPQQLFVEILGPTPLELDSTHFRGVRATVRLPEAAVVEACQIGSVNVAVDVGPLSGLGPMRALVVICPLRKSAIGANSRFVFESLGESTMIAIQHRLRSKNPFRWLIIPWLLLLMPFVIGSSVGPISLVTGACLTLVSFTSSFFVMANMIILVHGHFITFAIRWRRLLKLRILRHRLAHVDVAFGQHGPCCICLGEPTSDEVLIALLPCRHALHMECYSNWVRAASYPVQDLICPLCRRRTDALGKLAP